MMFVSQLFINTCEIASINGFLLALELHWPRTDERSIEKANSRNSSSKISRPSIQILSLNIVIYVIINLTYQSRKS